MKTNYNIPAGLASLLHLLPTCQGVGHTLVLDHFQGTAGLGIAILTLNFLPIHPLTKTIKPTKNV